MAIYNPNAGYGKEMLRQSGNTFGKTFVISAATSANYQRLSESFPVDPDGVVRVYATYTAALAACTADNGDKILVDPTYTTAPTLTELATAHSSNVQINYMHVNPDGTITALKEATTLPATTTGTLFTATGSVKVLDIVGEVTTTVQTQACNAALISVPTVGATQNLCAVLNITGLVTGSVVSITGTLATAMQATTTGVFVAQADPVVVPAGLVKLSTSATNTGALKWIVRYQPLSPGASLIPA